MAEELVLTDPVVEPEKVTAKYKVIELLTSTEAGINNPHGSDPGLVTIKVKDNLEVTLTHSYRGKAALDMIKWLNTANFSVNSMHKKILQRLTADGVIPPGTVTGTPDPPTGTF